MLSCGSWLMVCSFPQSKAYITLKAICYYWQDSSDASSLEVPGEVYRASAFAHVCQVLNNHSQTLDDTYKGEGVSFVAAAGIGGHAQAQMDGFPAKCCPQPAVGETEKQEQPLQTDYVSAGNSNTVLSLLLM